MKTLIIEDEKQIIDLIVSIAETIDANNNIKTARTFEKIKKLDIKSFNIIFVDLFLGDNNDGIEMLRYFYEKKVNAYIILMTGVDLRILNSAMLLSKELNLNLYTTLEKPFSIYEVKKIFVDLKEKQNNDKKMMLKKKPLKIKKQDITAEIIDKAIHDEEFVVLFQPQYNISNLSLYGMEALIRWDSSYFGMLSPNQFIYKIEKLNKIDDLTEYIIEKSFQNLKKISSTIPNLKISINLSPHSLKNIEIPEKIDSLAKKYNVTNSNIIIEITEGSAIKNFKSSLDVLNRLRIKGFNLSIDDFGTGHSSLAQLVKIPFSEIKIDRTFINSMLNNQQYESIIKLSIALAKELDMTVIAEGVETYEILERLKELGCEYAQGFLLSKPTTVDKIKPFLNNEW